MDRDEFDVKGTEGFESVSPESRDYYQAAEGEGVLGKAVHGIEHLLHHGTDASSHEENEELYHHAPDEGTTDYVTSNWAEDTGAAPPPTQIEDVSQLPPEGPS